MPTPKTQRKPLSGVAALPGQLDDFNDHDKISDFSSIDESLCSSGYKLRIGESGAVFYKIKNCKTFDIPSITEAIVIDDGLHVKLFFSGSSIALPPWFVKGKDSRLTKNFYLEIFHHTSEVFQITEPQMSWMNYSKSDTKNLMIDQNLRQNFCNLP